MIATNNLTTTMQYFGKLSEAERELFLSVVTTKKDFTETKQETQIKRKRNVLPADFTVEAIYKKIVDANERKVPKRLKRLEELKRSLKQNTKG